jgi:hypothetical protein
LKIQVINSGLVHENHKLAGMTPSFAPGYQMRMFKGKYNAQIVLDSKPKQGPIKNQLRQIATKVKDDNLSFRSASRNSDSTKQAKRIEMSFYNKWKNKSRNDFGIKKIRKYSDNE